VIVFGDSGNGKSSLINMLEGDTQGRVSDGPCGVTYDSASYKKTIDGLAFNVYDTPALNDRWVPLVIVITGLGTR
jgi:predicted GTPase